TEGTCDMATARKATAKPAKKATTAKQAASTRPIPSDAKAISPKTMSISAPKATGSVAAELPKPKFNKDGIGYTKDFDVSFVKEQYEALQNERVRLSGQ